MLPSVRKAEKLVLEAGLDKEYAGITGIPSFTQAAVRLAYSKSGISAKGLVAATQSISGTGALRTGASFLKAFYPGNKRVYLPDPSWANHKAIFSHAGLEVDSYRYFNYDNLRLDFEGMVEDINRMPKGSIILLHACAHNPTGVDPDTRQWEILSKTLLANDHLPFFDMAYQGFASGDTNTDAYAIRRFVEDGHKPILAQSFAKNMVHQPYNFRQNVLYLIY